MARQATASKAADKKPRARNARPKIERAALKLFVHEGVDAATTREIAEKAGVSEGALYRHYKGKDELALSLFMETHNRLGQMMQAALSGPGTLDDKVHAAVKAYCELADRAESMPTPGCLTTGAAGDLRIYEIPVGQQPAKRCRKPPRRIPSSSHC